MTEHQHPITPPPELVREWLEESPEDDEFAISNHIATQAARWGADQELEACCEWVYNSEYCEPHAVLHLRAARRSKPPSLKEQALEGLKKVGAFTLGQFDGCSDFNEFEIAVDNIRRALEALDD